MTFIGGTPPPIGFIQQQERPGRIEYLYLTREQQAEVDEMNRQIDRLEGERLRCQIPQTRVRGNKTELFFQHQDYDERTPPTESEADLMCKTRGVMCPVAAQCKRLGQAVGDHGVWGGRVFVDGKDYYKKEEEHG